MRSCLWFDTVEGQTVPLRFACKIEGDFKVIHTGNIRGSRCQRGGPRLGVGKGNFKN